MALRRVLVVGCGGTGAATVAYIMDQLRSDLRDVGITDIPAGWQFVVIDAPLTPDAGPQGLRNVVEQGGRYIGVGGHNGSYTSVDNALTVGLHGEINSASRWLPARPSEVPVNVAEGAGQYRAIGRALLLNNAQTITEQLSTVVGGLNDAHEAMLATGLGAYDSNDLPIVIVVGSMAGGSGASMTLDVCRLLTNIPGVIPEMTTLFLATPEIFHAIPTASMMGIRPNALAMMGEIIAAQAGVSCDSDRRTLHSLLGPSATLRRIPFQRVIPVGGFAGAVGNAVTVGDGSVQSVYRILGHGIASLIMSPQATEEFIRFDLTNFGGSTHAGDAVLWDGATDDLVWGTFGYVRLTLGRDRYREYAAQRLAASVSDRLATLKETAQLSAEAAARFRTAECDHLGLWQQQSSRTLGEWFASIPRPLADVNATIDGDYTQFFAPTLPSAQGHTGQDWLNAAEHALIQGRRALGTKIDDTSVSWARQWGDRLAQKTLEVTNRYLAQHGLAAARYLLEEVKRHTEDILLPALRAETQRVTSTDIATRLTDRVRTLVQAARGVISAGRPFEEAVRQDIETSLRTQHYYACYHQASQVLQEYVRHMLAPLIAAVSEAERCSMSSRAPQHPGAQTAVLAEAASDNYKDWPQERNPLPKRFVQTGNEVSITPGSQFPQQFQTDILHEADTSVYADALQSAVTTVAHGDWPVAGGQTSPSGFVTISRTWIPIPADGVPKSGAFSLDVTSPSLLHRSRAYVDRAGESFDRFCSLSLRDFAMATDVEESRREAIAEERQAITLNKFRDALGKCLPLATLDTSLIAQTHPAHGVGLPLQLKITEVPFAGLPLAQSMLELVDDPTHYDHTTVRVLQSALNQHAHRTSIGIFSSYGNYVTLALHSLWKPVYDQWAAAQHETVRESFWRWRSTRPLAACIPMTTTERRACVAGWILGRLTGRLDVATPLADGRYPGGKNCYSPRVYNAELKRWQQFPDPLLTPVERMRVPSLDWLPSVLESYLIAMAQAGATSTLKPLEPYKALRALFDDSQVGSTPAHMVCSGEALLAQWLNSGVPAPNGESSITGEPTFEARKLGVSQYLTKLREFALQHMPDGYGQWPQTPARLELGGIPFFRDIAEDVLWATDQLLEFNQRAKESVLPAPEDTKHPSTMGEIQL